MIGVLPVEDALAIARSRGLDLVEVNPNADPPVCKLLSLARFRMPSSAKRRQSRFERIRSLPFLDEWSGSASADVLVRIRISLQTVHAELVLVDEGAPPPRAEQLLCSAVAELRSISGALTPHQCAEIAYQIRALAGAAGIDDAKVRAWIEDAGWARV